MRRAPGPGLSSLGNTEVVALHGSRTLLACLGSLVMLATGGVASAAPWATFGGSVGRSSFAAGETTGPPLALAWRATAPWDQGIWTSPIVTQGARPLVAYGSQKPDWLAGPMGKGNVHLRDLVTGEPIGPLLGTSVDDGIGDSDTFGGGNKASVPFVDSTAPGGPPGQLFVVHNDDASGPDSDVAIAQIDEVTGDLVQEVPVPDTPHVAGGGAPGRNGSDVSGSPAFQLDEAGNGVLVFRVGAPVYAPSGETVRKVENVHVVPVLNARSRQAVIDVANQRVTPDFQPTSRTSPTLVTLADPDGSDRTATYIAMGTSERGRNQYVKTFRLSDLEPGPKSDTLAGWGQTVAVPMTPSGLPAGAPGSGIAAAPFLVVATSAGRVYKLAQRDGRLAVVASAKLAGQAAPALALNALVGPGGATAGRIVVTTEHNLYVLDAGDLRTVATFSSTPLRTSCAPCTRGETPASGAEAGFLTTAPVIAANTIYVARDDGSQLVLDLETAQPVPADQFRQDAGNAGSTFTRGQPAVAHGFAIFASDKGLFAYRLGTRAADPAAAGTAGAAGASRARGPIASLRIGARMRLRTVRRRGLVVRMRLTPWTRAGTRVVRLRLYAVRKGKRRRLVSTTKRGVRRPAPMRVALLTRAVRRRLPPGTYRLEVTVGDGRHQFGPPVRRRIRVVR